MGDLHNDAGLLAYGNASLITDQNESSPEAVYWAAGGSERDWPVISVALEMPEERFLVDVALTDGSQTELARSVQEIRTNGSAPDGWHLHLSRRALAPAVTNHF